MLQHERESDADGDQDLNLWARELEDVCREIMEDPVFKGNQNFKFEIDLDEAGRRLLGGETNTGVAFQIGQLRYFILLNMYVHDTYIHVCNRQWLEAQDSLGDSESLRPLNLGCLVVW